MTSNEFVEHFFEKYGSLVNRVVKKYLIPNRYNQDDIRQYIAERIITILNNRVNDPNKILDPEKYFKSCLDFYCIEYQRMHGYIFDLPKRPRKNCEEDESHARSYGFKYIGDMTVDESQSLLTQHDIDPVFSSWGTLTGILDRDEADVIECIYFRNMTWSETSKFLSVAQSTCWFRKNRALNKIYMSFDTMSGENTMNNVRGVLRGKNETIEDFKKTDS